jgi:ribonuclease HI
VELRIDYNGHRERGLQWQKAASTQAVSSSIASFGWSATQKRLAFRIIIACMEDSLPRVTVYTDGACFGNPGPGGWAAVLSSAGQEKVLSGGEPGTTNNRMELTAAIQALQALKRPCRVDVYTDSEYLRRGITEWLAGWKARGWRRKDGELLNADLWRALDAAQARHQVEWHWVHGHAGHAANERVDQLARDAIPKNGRK